jgi:membrane protein implicated in regulation of membrane protease activity
MSWSDIYLLCFLIGFSLSVLSFLAGAVHLHLPLKWHLPFHSAHHGAGGHHAGGAAKGGAHLSWLNTSTILAFLAWFGGTGYILTTHSNLVALASLAIAIAAGLVAGWLVFRFMSRLLSTNDAQMNEWDYRHEGAVCNVSISIPANGTGEVIFEQHGIRRSAGARSEDGSAIEKGAEVVITRYEKGIAQVKRWSEFSGEKV